MRQAEQNKLTAFASGDVQSAAAEDPWEAAYLRYETQDEEIHKFRARLLKLGARGWPRDSRILELFCGRGNGLHALQELGFTRLEGADLSPRLIADYRGPAACCVCDCTQLPFANQSKDVLIVQGGLHHLPTLPDSLDQAFSEMHRVLRKDGQLVLVEPWLTPFLKLVHVVCENTLARRLSSKVDALATMIHYERPTYERWLSQPDMISCLSRRHFSPVREFFAWGKWHFVGKCV